ncbi:MAG: hypothetical protein WCG04_03455 [Alphaproteobacteria bacterium]
MKKIFIISLLLLAHYNCAAAEGDEELGLSKTHRTAITKTGQNIFYPKEYATYEEFQKAHIVSLLSDRLELLSNLKKLGNMSKQDRLYYEMCLDRNEIVLVNNLDHEVTSFIFGQNEVRDNQSIQHEINVAKYLKLMFPQDKGIQDELDQLIKEFAPLPLEEEHRAALKIPAHAESRIAAH